MSVVNTVQGRQVHLALMRNFLVWLNQQTSDFVLKGGTALMLCYNLGRFSEDIDLDALNVRKNILPFITSFCKLNKLNFRIAKDTNTTKRCIVHYLVGNEEATLKIETSYRSQNGELLRSLSVPCNNILVYNINELFKLKLNAFFGRDKIRDIYDVLYTYKLYKNVLYVEARSDLFRALSTKSLDAILETIAQQSDPLIDATQLEDLYLSTCVDLGVQLD